MIQLCFLLKYKNSVTDNMQFGKDLLIISNAALQVFVVSLRIEDSKLNIILLVPTVMCPLFQNAKCLLLLYRKQLLYCLLLNTNEQN